MTDSSSSQKTPDTFVGIRLVIAALTLFVIVLIGFGLDGWGPLGLLSTVTDHIVEWIHQTTGLSLR